MRFIPVISNFVFLFLSVVEVSSIPHKPGFFKDLIREESRIVGGLKAKRHQFPFIASIQYRGRHLCGGSLITKNRVMTAAHCKMHGDRRYFVVLGMFNMNEFHEDVQRIKVKTFSILPTEVPRHVTTQDIGFVVLSRPAQLTHAVQLIPLPTEEQCDATGSTALAGWGAIESYIKPTTMMWAEMRRITNKQCSRDLEMFLLASGLLHDTMICASTVWDPVSACNGDSGGPLVYNGTVVGVISWGLHPCGTVGAPTVFTRVCNYLDYVKGSPINAVYLYTTADTLFIIVFLTCINNWN